MNERKNEILAAIITALITLAVLLFMLFYVLPGVVVPPKEQPYVTMMEDAGGDMLAKIGETADPTESETNDQAEPETSENNTTANSPEGDEMTDAGKQASVPPNNVTTPKSSPMTVKKSDDTKQSGASKTNPKQNSKAANKKSQGGAPKESKEAKRVQNSFGSDQGKGATQGSPSGGSNVGDISGHGTIGSGLVGYTAEKWGRPHSRYEGSITVKVTVDARGNVIAAVAEKGTGEAWKHADVRANCERESLKSRFSVPTNRTTYGYGTIIWRFK